MEQLSALPEHCTPRVQTRWIGLAPPPATTVPARSVAWRDLTLEFPRVGGDRLKHARVVLSIFLLSTHSLTSL